LVGQLIVVCQFNSVDVGVISSGKLYVEVLFVADLRQFYRLFQFKTNLDVLAAVDGDSLDF